MKDEGFIVFIYLTVIRKVLTYLTVTRMVFIYLAMIRILFRYPILSWFWL